jgi:hypothetical protein
MNKNNAYSNSPAGALSAEAKIKCETTKTQHEKDKRRIIPRGDKWCAIQKLNQTTHIKHPSQNKTNKKNSPAGAIVVANNQKDTRKRKRE